WERPRAIRTDLSRRFWTKPPIGKEEAHLNHYRKLSQEKGRLQGQLAELSAPFANRLKSSTGTVKDLVELLPDDVAVGELLKTQRFVPAKDEKTLLRSEDFYEAFVIRKTRVESGYEIRWIELPSAAEL